MNIFAISDLHLSFGHNKPMDIFGDIWINHVKKITDDWNKKVCHDDLVLLSGDFSWAMKLKDTIEDFEFLNKLPGKKLLLKGNHDYWWETLNKMRNFLKENQYNNIDFIYNNSYFFNGYIISGSRGWSKIEYKENRKILNRELIRMEISIKDGIEKYGADKPIIICMHYPPTEEFMQLFEKYNIKKVIYGHLHGASHKYAIEGKIKDIEYNMVSCDYTNFKITTLI